MVLTFIQVPTPELPQSKTSELLKHARDALCHDSRTPRFPLAYIFQWPLSDPDIILRVDNSNLMRFTYRQACVAVCGLRFYMEQYQWWRADAFDILVGGSLMGRGTLRPGREGVMLVNGTSTDRVTTF